jgi:hypothetical protein
VGDIATEWMKVRVLWMKNTKKVNNGETDTPRGSQGWNARETANPPSASFCDLKATLTGSTPEADYRSSTEASRRNGGRP